MTEPFIYQGRVLLNWRDKPAIHHDGGCFLCCTFRVRIGDRERHPGDLCPMCGAKWNNRRPDLCRICGTTAHFLDDGRPVHKTCRELELTAELRRRAVA